MLSFKRVALGSFFVAMLGVCANAALLAHWKLDEGTSNGEDVSGDAGLDETGVLNGTYDGGFSAVATYPRPALTACLAAP